MTSFLGNLARTLSEELRTYSQPQRASTLRQTSSFNNIETGDNGAHGAYKRQVSSVAALSSCMIVYRLSIATFLFVSPLCGAGENQVGSNNPCRPLRVPRHDSTTSKCRRYRVRLVWALISVFILPSHSFELSLLGAHGQNESSGSPSLIGSRDDASCVFC